MVRLSHADGEAVEIRESVFRLLWGSQNFLGLLTPQHSVSKTSDVERGCGCGGCKEDVGGIQLQPGGPCAEAVAMGGCDVLVFGALVNDDGVGEDADDGQGEKEGQDSQA
jgi:hypothetical protein